MGDQVRAPTEPRHANSGFSQLACLAVYNIPIQEGENRFSIVGYTTGMLFRHEVLLQNQFEGLSKKEKEELLASTVHERLEEGWSQYSTLDELCHHAAAK